MDETSDHDLIDVSSLASDHGFPNDRVWMRRDAWQCAIAWNGTPDHAPFSAEIAGRVTNVLRWLRPAVRRLDLTARSRFARLEFCAFYVRPKLNGVAPGEKHQHLVARIEGDESAARRDIVISLR